MSEGHETTNETKYLQIQLVGQSWIHMVVAWLGVYGSRIFAYAAIFAQGNTCLHFVPTHPHLTFVFVEFWVSAIPVVSCELPQRPGCAICLLLLLLISSVKLTLSQN